MNLKHSNISPKGESLTYIIPIFSYLTTGTRVYNINFFLIYNNINFILIIDLI